MIEFSMPIREYRIDSHVHLAGLGHGKTRCRIEPKRFHSLLFRLLRSELGIFHAHHHERLDQAYLERLRKDLSRAVEHKHLDGVALYAHDQIHDDLGRIVEKGQELFVPNQYPFAIAERPGFVGRVLPVMSIHPYRKDAIARTEAWIASGAAGMKWLPNSQNIDPQDPRCIPIFSLLARYSIPLIVHTGGEHTVKVLNEKLGNPEIMRPALEMGVTVVLAHCATASGIFDRNWLPEFKVLVTQYPNCYGDTSAICTHGRLRWIASLLEDQKVVDKLVHGSDFPIPPAVWPSVFRLGFSQCMKLAREPSFLVRDVLAKRSLGFPDDGLTRFSKLLPEPLLKLWLHSP